MRRHVVALRRLLTVAQALCLLDETPKVAMTHGLHCKLVNQSLTKWVVYIICIYV